MNGPGLSERKQKILHAVVTDYIQTAEPVGSRAISRRHRMNLSAATIRNEMADLEEMGYLSQPHTSAGRIPSQRGYRFYVDYLMDIASLTSKEEENLAKFFNQLEKMREIDQIIQHTCKILSDLTNYTALVLGPQFGKSVLQHLRLIPLNEEQALVVIITDTGIIKNIVVDLPRALSHDEIVNVMGYLNEQLAGHDIHSLTSSRLQKLRHDLYDKMQILESTLMLLDKLCEESGTRVFMGGASKILNQPEFKDFEKLKRLLSLFEQDNRLSFLLETPHDGVTIRIGTENELQEMRDCSLITATYYLNDRPVGVIGVLGPTRMEYSRVVAIIENVAGRLNSLLR